MPINLPRCCSLVNNLTLAAFFNLNTATLSFRFVGRIHIDKKEQEPVVRWDPLVHDSRLCPLCFESELHKPKAQHTHSSFLSLKEAAFNPSILRRRQALKINLAGRSSAAPPKSTPTWHLLPTALRRPHKNKATASLPRTFGAAASWNCHQAAYCLCWPAVL